MTGEQQVQTATWAMPAGLMAAVDAVRDWQKAFEGEFLQLGRQLIEVTGRLRQARDATMAIAEAVLGGDGDAAIVELRGVGIALTGLSALDRECHGGLLALHGEAAAPARSMGHITEAFTRLRHLALLADVEVARLAAADQTQLGVFVHALVTLVAQGRATGATMLVELSGIRTGLAAALRMEARIAARRRRSVATVNDQLAKLIDGLLRHREATQTVALADAALFEAIWRAVSDVVVRIQFQDQARQRWEHVQAAILQMPDVARTGRMDGLHEVLDEPRRRQALAALARAELVELEQDLVAETARLRSSLVDLAARAADAERDLDMVFGAGLHARSSVLQQLEARAAAALRACGTEATSWEGVRAAILEPVEAAGHLQASIDTLRDLEVDMRLAGLNATLRASRLQAGSTMQEIAREIRKEAAIINGETTSTIAAVGSLAGSAAGLTERTLAGVDAGEASARQGLDRGSAAVRSLERSVRASFAAAAEATHGLSAILRQVEAGLGTCRAGPAALRDLAALVAAVAADHEEGGPAPAWPELERLVEERYSSRRHTRGTAEASAPAEAADDLSGVLF